MQKFLNNFNTTFIASVKDTAVTGTPATELDYGILRISDGAAGTLSNPTGGDFYVLTAYKKSGTAETNIEIMRVTAVDNSVINECRITVLRAQEGTTAKAYVSGDYISLRLTAGGTGQFAQVSDLTKAAVGLGNVDNTSDALKPVSAAQAAAIAAGGYTHPANHPPSIITQDAGNRFVTDAEKASWNAKGNGDVTLEGTQTLTNKTITEIVFALTGTTPAFTATNGAVQTWTLTAASTPTNALTTGQSIILVITPGAFAITWPAVIWTKQGGSGAAPTLFTAGKTSVVLWRVGAVLYGSHLGDHS